MYADKGRTLIVNECGSWYYMLHTCTYVQFWWATHDTKPSNEVPQLSEPLLPLCLHHPHLLHPTITSSITPRLRPPCRHHRRHARSTPPRASLLYLVVGHYTLLDPLVAVRRIHALLAVGGQWVNVGPLQWHQEATGALRLTLNELLGYAGAAGFALKSSRTIRRVPYVRQSREGDGLLSSGAWHDVAFFVAQKVR